MLLFTCKLNSASRTTLTDQLYSALREEITSGRMAAGEKLPSKRQLSEHLHVSTATVEAAYGRLISEGYCESRPRSGIYAAKDLPQTGTAIHPRQVPILWDFSTGAADAEHFPFSTWARLMREVLSEQNTSLLLSGDPQGSPELRREIAGMMLRLRGIEVSPECIVLGAGTEVLVTALVSLLGREKLFAVEDPGYSRVRRILVASGARIAPTPLLGGSIDVRALYTSGAGAVYVTPSHQFPLGGEMGAQERSALLHWARETGSYILEDDYDSEFRFTGVSLPALKSMDSSEQVIYMNTFARTLAPGLRLSFMVLPQALIGRYRAMHAACSVPGFEQETLRKFISGGYLERHVARMRVVYRGRLQALEKRAAELGLGEVAPCGAGLYALLHVGGKTPAQELVPLAASQGVRLTRLADYGVMETGKALERVVLLGFAGMDEQAIGEGLEALRRAWI